MKWRPLSGTPRASSKTVAFPQQYNKSFSFATEQVLYNEVKPCRAREFTSFTLCRQKI